MSHDNPKPVSMNPLLQEKTQEKAKDRVKVNEELDPLFLRKQSLAEDLARLAAFEASLRRIDRKTLYALRLGNAQAAAIQTIAQQGGACCVGEIQQSLAVSKQSLHKSLERLEAGGYIRQQGRDEKDRRRHIFALTGKGQKLEQLLHEQRAAALRKAYRAANAQQVEGFRRTLAQLNEGRQRLEKTTSYSRKPKTNAQINDAKQ